MPNIIGTLFHKDIPYGGVKGDKGDTGATPNISATASVNASTGTPSVNVVKTGTAENPSFEFEFENLKGEKGDPGSGSSVSWGEIDGDISDQTDLMDELDDKTDNSVVGTVESGSTASKAYTVGEHFIRDGAFCTAIAAIAQGATFTLNTNYTAESIADVCKTLLTAINQLSGSLATVATTGSYSDLTDEPTNRSASNGSTTVSLCTRGEKYTWNNKVNLKSATFSGTTASGGEIKLSTSARHVIDVKYSQSGIYGYAFIYSDGATWAKVFNDNTGAQVAGKAVSGTYYYIDTGV